MAKQSTTVKSGLIIPQVGQDVTDIMDPLSEYYNESLAGFINGRVNEGSTLESIVAELVEVYNGTKNS